MKIDLLKYLLNHKQLSPIEILTLNIMLKKIISEVRPQYRMRRIQNSERRWWQHSRDTSLGMLSDGDCNTKIKMK